MQCIHSGALEITTLQITTARLDLRQSEKGNNKAGNSSSLSSDKDSFQVSGKKFTFNYVFVIKAFENSYLKLADNFHNVFYTAAVK